MGGRRPDWVCGHCRDIAVDAVGDATGGRRGLLQLPGAGEREAVPRSSAGAAIFAGEHGDGWGFIGVDLRFEHDFDGEFPAGGVPVCGFDACGDGYPFSRLSIG